MAELLIMAVDITNPNTAKSTRGCYKRGDVVGVAPDGWNWASGEGRPRFYILKITDVTRAQVYNWVLNNWDTVLDCVDLDVDRNPMNYKRRRRVRFDLDLIPAAVLNTLNSTGQYSNTWANIRDYVRNKLTNATCSGVVI